jgi:hypothetical protein
MTLGRLLVAGGGALLFGGLLVLAAERVPFLSWIGRLPGDLRFQGARTRFVFPFTSCLILSALLTVALRIARVLLARR